MALHDATGNTGKGGKAKGTSAKGSTTMSAKAGITVKFTHTLNGTDHTLTTADVEAIVNAHKLAQIAEANRVRQQEARRKAQAAERQKRQIAEVKQGLAAKRAALLAELEAQERAELAKLGIKVAERKPKSSAKPGMSPQDAAATAKARGIAVANIAREEAQGAKQSA